MDGITQSAGLTIACLARRLGVDEKTIRRHYSTGTPVVASDGSWYRIGRYDHLDGCAHRYIAMRSRAGDAHASRVILVDLRDR
jgi:hypothetical protein